MTDEKNSKVLLFLEDKKPQEVDSKQSAKSVIDQKSEELFDGIVQEYRQKLITNKHLKKVLFYFSIIVLSIMILAFFACLGLVIYKIKTVSEILAILIPAAVSIISSVISIIIIIAKYLFPQDEDKYFIALISELRQKR